MGACLGKPNQGGASSSGNTPSKSGSNRGASAGTGVQRKQESGKKDFGLGERYEPIKFLGRGGFSDTWLFRDLKTKETVAIKLMRRPVPPVLETSLLREILIQTELGWGHENVVKAYEAILTPSHFALVMEVASGGSLTSYVSERFNNSHSTGLFLSEDEARFFFRQFISAVSYCHKNNVAHRDLKLDNTLLDSSDPPLVKLCDFGFAKSWESENANMMTHIGTPVYMAPELVQPDSLPGLGGSGSAVLQNGSKKGYDGRKVDAWASGILLLVMLLGTFPFDHINNTDPNAKEAHMEIWMQQMQLKWYDIPRVSKSIDKLSEDIKDLLSKIFVVDEAERIGVEEIVAHPWYNKPLLPSHQVAWEGLCERQKELNLKRADVHVNEALKAAREKKLKQLVALASKRADLVEGGSKTISVNLLEEDVVQPQATTEALGNIAE